MNLLREMAKYHQQTNHYLYSGLERFMKHNEDIFRKYNQTLKVDDQGYLHVQITVELTAEQAKSLGDELVKADDDWFAELDEFGYGGYIQDFSE